MAVTVLAASLLALGSLVAQLRVGRLRRRDAEADVPLLGDLVALGLDAGLPFIAALGAARDHVASDLASEVGGVLRRARRHGVAAALGSADGLAAGLYAQAARAVATGAPLAGAVEAFVREARHAERAHAEAAARRLPVRLLLPLALLILPGFVLLAVGPAVVTALERLNLPGQ